MQLGTKQNNGTKNLLFCPPGAMFAFSLTNIYCIQGFLKGGVGQG